MPIILIFIGAVFIVAAIRGTHKELFEILRDDFGTGNFLLWGSAIFFIGAIGYSKTLRPLSNSFLTLLFVAILLTSGRGFFDQLRAQLRN